MADGMIQRVRGRARRAAARQPVARRAVLRYRARTLDARDTYLVAYPKSGSTWLRFMLAQSLGGEPDFREVATLVPALGWHDHPRALTTPDGGRLIKVHDQAPLLRATPPRKAIVMVRDGRDVAVSYYYHLLRDGLFAGTFPEFLDDFLAGRVDAYGRWPDHVDDWLSWEGTVHIIRYEDLLARGPQELAGALAFLGLEVDEASAAQVYEDCRPDRMRAREVGTEVVSSSGKRVPRTEGFVRGARAGDWSSHFDERASALFDAEAGAVLRRLDYA